MFNPKLHGAKQLGREIFRPQLALAQIFPLLRWRVRHSVTPHDPAQFHRLACTPFPIFPFPQKQVCPAISGSVPQKQFT
jgi:hypothetical protein